jgi:hypothetical protein
METSIIESREKVKIFWPLAIPANIIVISIIAVPVLIAIISTLLYLLIRLIIRRLDFSNKLPLPPEITMGKDEESATVLPHSICPN